MVETTPSDLILRRPRSSRGRLEGWPRARCRLWPSFETRASFDRLRSALLRTRLTDEIYDFHNGNAVLDEFPDHRSSLSNVIGRSATRLAVAGWIAVALAAGTPTMPISPTPVTPHGLDRRSGS